MIRVLRPGKVRHLVQAHLDNCREERIALNPAVAF